MDADQARARLRAERAEVADLLKGAESAGQQDREAGSQTGDIADSAQPLAAQGVASPPSGHLTPVQLGVGTMPAG